MNRNLSLQSFASWFYSNVEHLPDVVSKFETIAGAATKEERYQAGLDLAALVIEMARSFPLGEAEGKRYALAAEVHDEHMQKLYGAGMSPERIKKLWELFLVIWQQFGPKKGEALPEMG